MRERDDQWRKACKEIIDRCVAPDMYPQAMAMLDRAYKAAVAGDETLPRVVVDCNDRKYVTNEPRLHP